MDELEELIFLIQDKYDEINCLWKKIVETSFNLKRIKVVDACYDFMIFSYIVFYQEFIYHNISEFVDLIEDKKFKNKIQNRVKELNSICFKLMIYNEKENGKLELRKCLNDIFGIRIIIDEDFDLEAIEKIARKNKKELKCLNSSNGDYKAIHIYFGNDDNKNFQWELQIWNSKNEKNNLISHHKYKQYYVEWPNETKENNERNELDV